MSATQAPRHDEADDTLPLAQAAHPLTVPAALAQARVRCCLDADSRRRAWRLTYAAYHAAGYAAANAQGEWCTRHHRLPVTSTFLAECGGRDLGTVSVVPDSPAGLPADDLYAEHLAPLRRSGGRLCETISLVEQSGDPGLGALVLTALYQIGWATVVHLDGCTDAIITVNPRHVPFYCSVMGLTVIGPQRDYGTVSGAPAVLLHRDLSRDGRDAGDSEAPLRPPPSRRFQHGSRPSRALAGWVAQCRLGS